MRENGEKIGVALGGGTMRGMAHLGVLEVLEENKIPIDILVGCSSGAIVAAAYACGRLKELNEIALTLQKKDLRRILDFWMTGEGLIKGRRLRSLFDYLTAHKNFSDIEGIKLAFVGTNALTGEEVVIDKGSIAAALEITTALPGLASLRRYEGKLVFDGGTAMLVPAKAAYDLGADKVIAVDVSVNRSIVTRMVGDFRKLMRNTRLGKMAQPVFWIQEKILNLSEQRFLGKAREVMKRIYLLDDYEKHKFNFIEAYLIGLKAISKDYKRGLFDDHDCDVAIHPDVLGISRGDVSHVREMVSEGKKATKKALGKIKDMLASS